MSNVHIFIKNCFSYRKNECIMHYIDYIDINLILSELNNNKEFILKKEKNIIGKKVFPFNYKNRKGDIMTYQDKYVIITLYPVII